MGLLFLWPMHNPTDFQFIKIRGARVNNLKNVSLDIPLKKMICFAGPSGSGKTSLAFHTLLTESKRRFVNSFPNSMKFFADRPSAVDVDEIYPVLPVFGLPQINPVMGSRSVAGDILRVTETLQGLFYHYSKEYCPTHQTPLEALTFGAVVKKSVEKVKGDVFHLFLEAQEFQSIFGGEFFPPRSFSPKRKTVSPFEPSDAYYEVIRFKKGDALKVHEKLAEHLSKFSKRNFLLVSDVDTKGLSLIWSNSKQCSECDHVGKTLTGASVFSPYNSLGACKSCNGYGANLIWDQEKILNRDLSVLDGALIFLKYKPFEYDKAEFLKLMKKKGWDLTTPVKKFPKEFFNILENGEGKFSGQKELYKYLESKRYKPSVQIGRAHV